MVKRPFFEFWFSRSVHSYLLFISFASFPIWSEEALTKLTRPMENDIGHYEEEIAALRSQLQDVRCFKF